MEFSRVLRFTEFSFNSIEFTKSVFLFTLTQIQSKVVTVAANSESCSDVMVDSGLGRDTMFSFSWTAENKPFTIKVSNQTSSEVLTNQDNTASYKCVGQCDVGSIYALD